MKSKTKGKKAVKKVMTKTVTTEKVIAVVKKAVAYKAIEPTNKSLAQRQFHKELAAILVDPKRKKEHRSASNKLFKEFDSNLIFYFMRKIGTNAKAADLKDLTIQTLEKMFAKINLYQPDKSEFSTWVYKIALNCLIDHIRVNKKMDVVSVEALNHDNVRTFGEQDAEFFELRSNDLTPSDLAERGDQHGRVREAVEALTNDTERTIVKLRYFEEMSYEEIAKQLELPMGTVKAMLFRAKEHLRPLIAPRIEVEMEEEY